MDPRRQIVQEFRHKKELKQLDEVHMKQLHSDNRRLFFHSLEFEEPEQEFFWDYYDLGFQYEELDYDLECRYEEFDYEDDLFSVQLSPSPSTYAIDETFTPDQDRINMQTPSLSVYMEKLLTTKADLYRQKHTWSRLVLRILKNLRQRFCQWRKDKKNKVTEEKKQIENLRSFRKWGLKIVFVKGGQEGGSKREDC